MAGEAEEVVVKIDETPAPDVVVKADDPVKDLAAQYKELEARTAEQTAAREQADRDAAAARSEAEQSRREANAARSAASASNLDTITTALAAAQGNIEAAKRDMRVAKEAGDLDAELDAQDRLTTARIDFRTYDEAKATMEARSRQPARPSDPVEAYVQNRTEQTANWLRAHRDYITDPRKNAKLTAAHHDAIAEGLQTDTPEYFSHVESFVGLKKADAEVTEGDKAQRPSVKRAARAAVAPVNGGSGSGTGGGNEVRLSASEAASATDGTLVWNFDDPSGQKKFRKGDVIGIQEMARRKLAMTKQGLYDKTYLEQ